MTLGCANEGPTKSRTLSGRVRDDVLSIASAAARSISPEDILGGSRLRPVVYARHHAAWLLRQQGYSFPQIGLALRQDHTTVMAAVRGHEDRLKRRLQRGAV